MIEMEGKSDLKSFVTALSLRRGTVENIETLKFAIVIIQEPYPFIGLGQSSLFYFFLS